MSQANIRYRLIRSDRKTLGLEITATGEVLIRAPRFMPEAEIQRLVETKRSWILKALARMEKRTSSQPDTELLSEAELRDLAEEARSVFPDRVRYHAQRMGITYGRITLRCQKTRWGSCSTAGNLNFNILLMLAPREVLDSVIIHELCHRKYMNHSPAFWNEVHRWCPDYAEQRRWLKEHGAALLARAGQ